MYLRLTKGINNFFLVVVRCCFHQCYVDGVSRTTRFIICIFRSETFKKHLSNFVYVYLIRYVIFLLGLNSTN